MHTTVKIAGISIGTDRIALTRGLAGGIDSGTTQIRAYGLDTEASLRGGIKGHIHNTLHVRL